jgi:hypothetical protein
MLLEFESIAALKTSLGWTIVLSREPMLTTWILLIVLAVLKLMARNTSRSVLSRNLLAIEASSSGFLMVFAP